MTKGFELLIRKDIIAILDGDIKFDDRMDSIMGMPYLSGAALCKMSNEFGLYQENGLSRWMYLDNLFHYVIDKGICDELLRYMFDLERFYQLESLGSHDEIIKTYKEICTTAISQINAKLALGRHELKYVAGHFFVTDTDSVVEVSAPNLGIIDVSYVRELPGRCNEALLLGDYDSVITRSRTLIEEVLVYVLERHNQSIDLKGDIGKLYNQVKGLYSMQQSKNYDGRVNSLLAGLERIVESIGAMRNVNSDAHGVGSKRIRIKEREARLAMNSAMAFCEYILSINE